MMRRTADAVADTVQREGLAKPSVIAVTVLTSMDDDQLKRVGIDESAASLVSRFASLAQEAGMDGVVASPQEISLIRQTVSIANFLIVTPGIRKATVAADDQSRVMTAADAIKAGADYLVIGRPILNAPDPIEAAQQIANEISIAMTTGTQAL
jgi:orotidine-5'-phosphate decarboxylase